MFVRIDALALRLKSELRNDGSTNAELHASLFLLAKSVFDLFVDGLPAVHAFPLIGHLSLRARYRLVALVAVCVDVDLASLSARFRFGPYGAGFQRREALFKHSDTFH